MNNQEQTLSELEDTIKQNAIMWNKKQFYRAIGDERFDDAKRHKENIERLEGQQ